MISGISNRRRFADLTEQEVLALAISSEEDDARIYRTFAQRLRAEYPASAAVFDDMAAESSERPERITILAAPQAFFGLMWDGWVLRSVVIFLAASTVWTVIQRVRHVARHA